MNKKAEHWRVPDIEKAPPPHKPNAPAAQMATCRLFNTKHGCRNEDKTSVITKMENLLQIQCRVPLQERVMEREKKEVNDMTCFRGGVKEHSAANCAAPQPVENDEHPRVNNTTTLAVATSWQEQRGLYLETAGCTAQILVVGDVRG